MKKNGFTLVELIATIVLIALLATVILLNMVGVKDKQDISSANNFEKSIEEAACTYIDMKDQMTLRDSCKDNSNQDKCKITINTLIEAGLIEENLHDKKTNLTASEEKNIKVWIHFDNNNGYKEKKCTIQR